MFCLIRSDCWGVYYRSCHSVRCCHIIARSTEWSHLRLSFQLTVFLWTKASILCSKAQFFLNKSLQWFTCIHWGCEWIRQKTPICGSPWTWLDLLQEHYFLITKTFWIIPGFAPHKYSLLHSGNVKELKDIFRQEYLNASSHWLLANARPCEDMSEVEGPCAVGTEYSFLAEQLLGHFMSVSADDINLKAVLEASQIHPALKI